jgi:hypothetical protein
MPDGATVKIMFRVLAAVMILAGLSMWFVSNQRANEQRMKNAEQANERRLEIQQSGEKIKHKLDCQQPEKRAQMTREEIDQWCPAAQ